MPEALSGNLIRPTIARQRRFTTPRPVKRVNRGGLLTVPEGAIGLRQSDALFQHTVRLHEKIERSAAGRGARHRRQHPSPRGGRLVYAVFFGRRERRAERGAFAFRAAFYRVSSAGTYRGGSAVGWQAGFA